MAHIVFKRENRSHVQLGGKRNSVEGFDLKERGAITKGIPSWMSPLLILSKGVFSKIKKSTGDKEHKTGSRHRDSMPHRTLR